MELYYGTKKIRAQPMSLGAYNEYRGWTLPAEEDFTAPGYLVEYLDSPKPGMHPNHDNYISWSPADVFEAAYQRTDSLSFGHALLAMEEGRRLTRFGWNGKGQFVYYVPANSYPADRNTMQTLAGLFEDGMVPYEGYHALFNAQGKIVPWAPSQGDMAAKDWVIIG